jgi:hypothetical protein
MKEAVLRARQYLPPGNDTLRKNFICAIKQPFLCLLFTLLLACGTRNQVVVEKQSIAVSDTLVYESNSHPTDFQIVRVLGVVSTQTLEVHVLSNRTPDPGTLQLMTSRGYRASPMRTRRHPTNDEILVIDFEPIHSRRLFQETGLRGDIEPHYTLLLEQDAGSTEQLLFTSDTDRHHQALATFGQSATTIPYHIDVDSVLRATANLTRSTEERSFHISESEMLVQGLWIKFQSFHLHDTLSVELRIVNQSGDALAIDPATFTRISTSVHTPHDPPPAFILSNGHRASVKLRFACEATETVNLDFSSIRFSKNEEPTPRVVRLKRGTLAADL